MSVRDCDRERAKQLWQATWGNDRREGNVPRKFDTAFGECRVAVTQDIIARLRAYKPGYLDRDNEMLATLTLKDFAAVLESELSQGAQS